MLYYLDMSDTQSLDELELQYNREAEVDLTIPDIIDLTSTLREHNVKLFKWLSRLRSHEKRKMELKHFLDDYMEDQVMKDVGVLSKSTVEGKIKKSIGYKKILREVDKQDGLIKHLYRIVDNIKSMGFSFNNIIEMQKLEIIDIV